MPILPHAISRFSGLYTSVNPLGGRVPEGALEVADNVVIRSVDVMEPRRGYSASSPCVATSACDLANRPVPPPFSLDLLTTGAIGIGPVYCSGPNGTTLDFGTNALLDGNVALSSPGAGTYIPAGLWWTFVQGNAGIAIYNVPAGFVVSNSVDIVGIANWQGYFVGASADPLNPGTWRAICFSGGAWIENAGAVAGNTGCFLIG